MTLPRHRRFTPAFAVLLLLGLSACAPTAPAPASGPASSTAAVPDTHGIDAGSAAEVASPALALVVVDTDGALALLDLETEERTTIAAPLDRDAALFADGRFVYRAHEVGGDTVVEVIDTGRWTMPHGDHTHSFRGEPRTVGTLEGRGELQFVAGEQRATLHFSDGDTSDGDTVLLSHEILTDALTDAPADATDVFDAAPRTTLDATGPVTLFAGHLLVPGADASIDVIAPDADGAPDADPDPDADPVQAPAPDAGTGPVSLAGSRMPCTRASDLDTTRVGAVFTCAEGAVLFTRQVGGAVIGELIAAPAGAEPATELAGRADRPDLAGVAGTQGAWLLDVRQRTWTLLPSDVPLLRAVAIGDDDSHTVAVDLDGRVRVLADDGTVLARTEPLLAASVADPELRERVQLIVDARYAYVTDPATGAVHEIDHGDARVTRTFSDLDARVVLQVG